MTKFLLLRNSVFVCTIMQAACSQAAEVMLTVLPIPGTKRIKYLEDNAKAVDVDMSAEDLATIERLLKKYPNVGDRYNQHDFSFVDK